MKKITVTLQRFARHLFTPPWRARLAFPSSTLRAIESAIARAEKTHRGQIRFAVEAALDFAPLTKGVSARERAVDVFSQLRIWDTEHNNGVLIYLLLADRDVEIIADRGIHLRVGPAAWEQICQAMEARFRQGQFEAGVLDGIHAVGELLAQHYPGNDEKNELPDAPVIL